MITTDHSTVDYQVLVDHSKLLLDTRNATKSVSRLNERVHLL
jgi:UDP-N-acetyl-D-glucosamine dehydrogenase